MPDPPPHKELFFGRSLSGPSRGGAGSSQLAGARLGFFGWSPLTTESSLQQTAIRFLI